MSDLMVSVRLDLAQRREQVDSRDGLDRATADLREDVHLEPSAHEMKRVGIERPALASSG
ncbi:MAG: hypothetical protein WAM52_01830 [Steroidobacteraceae bacterium]